MPMHISPTIDTDPGRIASMSPRLSPIANSLTPATQSDIFGILQREQDRAMGLLSSSPLLASLFVSYANQAAALDPDVPSTESEEWKALENTIARLQEEVDRLKPENLEMAEKLGAAAASQEAFRSQISALKDVNTSQQDDIKSLREELLEAKNKYDRLLVESNAEKAALQNRVSDLEAERNELKEAVVEQQIKISRLERQDSSNIPRPVEIGQPVPRGRIPVYPRSDDQRPPSPFSSTPSSPLYDHPPVLDGGSKESLPIPAVAEDRQSAPGEIVLHRKENQREGIIEVSLSSGRKNKKNRGNETASIPTPSIHKGVAPNSGAPFNLFGSPLAFR